MSPEQQFEDVVRGLSTGGMFDELKVMAIVQAHAAELNKAIADVLFGIMEVISNEYDKAMEHPDDTDSSSAYAHAYAILKTSFDKHEQEKE